MSEPTAWLNGRFLPLSQAALGVLDAGVTGGVSVTERLRTFRHEPFLLAEHIARLIESAAAARVPLRLSVPAIEDVVRETAARNAVSVPREDDLTISFFATAGTPSGPTFCVHAAPLPAAHYAGDYAGQTLVIPPTPALPPDVLPPQVKTRSRLHWHLADAQADEIDPGTRPLLIDRGGLLTETAAGNLFVVRAGRLRTPDRRRTLRGISQDFLLRLADRLEIGEDEADLRPDDLFGADEAFTTSSVSCLLPVVRVDQRPVGDGRPGPVFRRLLAAWSEAVGIDIAGQMRRMAQTAALVSDVRSRT